MQDHREFARQRDFRFAHAGSPGYPHRPALKLGAAFDRLL
jgi:hypothetical protein